MKKNKLFTCIFAITLLFQTGCAYRNYMQKEEQLNNTYYLQIEQEKQNRLNMEYTKNKLKEDIDSLNGEMSSLENDICEKNKEIERLKKRKNKEEHVSALIKKTKKEVQELKANIREKEESIRKKKQKIDDLITYN